MNWYEIAFSVPYPTHGVLLTLSTAYFIGLSITMTMLLVFSFYVMSRGIQTRERLQGVPVKSMIIMTVAWPVTFYVIIEQFIRVCKGGEIR